MEEKFLPIGTIVLLKNASKEIMITGYLAISNENPDLIYDYSACFYPEGIISSEQIPVFNHEQIDKIIAVGYENENSKKFRTRIKELYAKQIEEDNSNIEIKDFINSIEIID